MYFVKNILRILFKYIKRYFYKIRVICTIYDEKYFFNLKKLYKIRLRFTKYYKELNYKNRFV